MYYFLDIRMYLLIIRCIRNLKWRRIFIVVNTPLFSVLDLLQRSVIVISSSLSNASSSREIYTQFACIIPWKWSIQWMSYTKSPIFVQQIKTWFHEEFIFRKVSLNFIEWIYHYYLEYFEIESLFSVLLQNIFVLLNYSWLPIICDLL